MQKLIESLRKKGLKITPQRLTIFKILKDNKSHPCAEEIYLKVRKEFPTISLATVYQTLDTLEHIGGVQVLRCDKKKTRYDGDLSLHHHLVCIKCNKIMDLQCDYSKTLKLPLSLKNQFEVNESKVVFYGICVECRKKSGSQNRKNRRKAQKKRKKAIGQGARPTKT
jgi:Fur family peroxide stress response transcriptional regulator